MKPVIAPTSPKSQPPSPVDQVWKAGALQQPMRTPWGRIVFLGCLVSLIAATGLMVGAVWLQRYGPVGWWTKWLPIVTTTTVIQSVNQKVSNDAPKAVQSLAETVAGLASTKSETDSYGIEDIQSTAVPLSDNGWVVTLQRPPAADGTGLVALRPGGDIEKITTWLPDPSSPFVFAKAGNTNDAPVTLGDAAKSVNQTVWVITAQVRDQQIFPRRVVGSSMTTWPSSDRLERTYQLDTSVDAPTGAFVVNQSGQLIGLMNTSNDLWPVSSIQPILKDLIQTGQFERTGAGFRARRRDELVIPNTPTAAGWLIGAGNDQVAIEPKGAADRAGLKSGDVITAIDGQAVQGDMFDAWQRWQPGETATVTILRAGSEREITIQFSSLHS